MQGCGHACMVARMLLILTHAQARHLHGMHRYTHKLMELVQRVLKRIARFPVHPDRFAVRTCYSGKVLQPLWKEP